MATLAEEYRYYSASAGELGPLTVSALAKRLHRFQKIHNEDVKFRARLAGAKV